MVLKIMKKYFLFNMFLAKVKSHNLIAIAVTSSEIAALLLDGGEQPI